ncbi:SIMPL domain-containing protein [Nannocystis radixulma]|uniref:SIMPL domain-containing protein n=1 Tax=Nannocystis radixulma TaxID=2995305 RepID=A0ABT5AXA5_9BACT|nr:SIMPL domain-containing protein [Nannocystis radixulma]MDC0666482.1 SIMPL domain-containing protein [Nannocystis radixulma]
MQPREATDTRTIEATGKGVVRAKPDVAVLKLGVTTQAEKPAEAVDQNAKRMSKVIAAVKAQGIPDTAIQTSELQLDRVTKWDEDLQTDVLVGYRATNVITVRSPVDTAVKVFDAGVAAGANTAGGLAFAVDDEKKYRREALAQATKVAVEDIEAVAKALGVNLDAVVQAEVMEATEPPLYESQFFAMDHELAATPIVPGQLEITSRVRVRYTIKVP